VRATGIGGSTDSGSPVRPPRHLLTPRSRHHGVQLCGQLPRGVGCPMPTSPAAGVGERERCGARIDGTPRRFLDGTLSLAPRPAASRGSGGIRSFTDLAGIWPVSAVANDSGCRELARAPTRPKRNSPQKGLLPTSLDSPARRCAHEDCASRGTKSQLAHSATYSRLGLMAGKDGPDGPWTGERRIWES
jgi:hypothetical protein